MTSDYAFDLEAGLAILESRLPGASFPDIAALRPFLRKLLEHPGSMVFLAIEAPRGPGGPRLAWAGFLPKNATNSARRCKN